MSAIATSQSVAVIGAGTMGAGIAQLAAAAGHHTRLFDSLEGAAEAGKQRIASGLEKLVTREKIDQQTMDSILSRVEIVTEIDPLAESALIVEAIVEDLDIKRDLFATLESIVSPETILATNTSSISITAIARDLEHPERVVGMHFFNPATVMKLVEVVSGLATSTAVAESVFATAEAWGKVAVNAKSTPGFIVNRVARPYYGEALRLYEEQVADPATLDALLTEGAGFRMGPFALMDLIGNDVNYAVSVSVFNAFYQEPRFRPSQLQLDYVNAGRLGRKSGHGFYPYGAKAQPVRPATETRRDNAPPIADFTLGEKITVDGALITPTDGRSARTLAHALGQPVIVYDLSAPAPVCSRVAFASSETVSAALVERFVATLDTQGIKATRLPDWPGLVVMRTVAMLANEGFEAVLQGVSDESGIDTAMRYGVNYPKGPMEWAREIGLARILTVLERLHEATGDPRYRASFGLRLALDP